MRSNEEIKECIDFYEKQNVEFESMGLDMMFNNISCIVRNKNMIVLLRMLLAWEDKTQQDVKDLKEACDHSLKNTNIERYNHFIEALNWFINES